VVLQEDPLEPKSTEVLEEAKEVLEEQLEQEVLMLDIPEEVEVKRVENNQAKEGEELQPQHELKEEVQEEVKPQAEVPDLSESMAET